MALEGVCFAYRALMSKAGADPMSSRGLRIHYACRCVEAQIFDFAGDLFGNTSAAVAYPDLAGRIQRGAVYWDSNTFSVSTEILVGARVSIVTWCLIRCRRAAQHGITDIIRAWISVVTVNEFAGTASVLACIVFRTRRAIVTWIVVGCERAPRFRITCVVGAVVSIVTENRLTEALTSSTTRIVLGACVAVITWA